jgi:hypothetical protein
METRRWTNPSHPDTLRLAVNLLYLYAVLTLFFQPWAPLVLAAFAGAVGAYGIANSMRWGYQLAVGAMTLVVALLVLEPLFSFGPDLVYNLNFLITAVVPVALFCLLVHPQSREHQRIWFD